MYLFCAGFGEGQSADPYLSTSLAMNVRLCYWSVRCGAVKYPPLRLPTLPPPPLRLPTLPPPPLRLPTLPPPPPRLPTLRIGLLQFIVKF